MEDGVTLVVEVAGGLGEEDGGGAGEGAIGVARVQVRACHRHTRQRRTARRLHAHLQPSTQTGWVHTQFQASGLKPPF